MSIDKEKLYKGITDIDESIIMEAENAPKKKPVVIRYWKAFSSAAAAIALITMMGIIGSMSRVSSNSMTGMGLMPTDGVVSDKNMYENSAETPAVQGITNNAGAQESFNKAESNSADIAPETNTGEIVGNQKLITTVTAKYETTDFDSSLKKIENRVSELKGYFESSVINGTKERSNRIAELVIRIPEDKAKQLKEELELVGNVLYYNEKTEDVTLQYSDVESYIKSLRIEQESLEKLLEKATKLSEIFEIQNQLTSVRQKIEKYESQLKKLDDKISYSTYTITLKEVKQETVFEEEEKSFGQEASDAFNKTLSDIGNGFRICGVWLAGAAPFIGIIAIIVIAVVVTIKIKIKKNKKNK